jgi:hypothetical protein
LSKLEHLVAGSPALRVYEKIHGTCRARSIGRALRSLPMKPHVGEVKSK